MMWEPEKGRFPVPSFFFGIIRRKALIKTVNPSLGKMTGDEKVKKSRDPIFTACLVIFMVAVVAILGGFVNDHYIQKDNTKAAYGDEVVVNYTGSYYAYVGEDNAVVFDTSLSSIGNDDDISKANSFTKTSYEPLTFTIGKGSMIKGFEEAVVGHKVGDTFTVLIPAGEGYVGYESKIALNAGSVGQVQEIPSAAFKAAYEDVKLVAGATVTFTTVYGWEATAIQSNNTVVVYNMPEAGKTYKYVGNEDNEFGDVKFKVNSVGDDIKFDYQFENTKSVGSDGDIEMIEMNLVTEKLYVSNVSGGYFTCETQEKNNIDLYFEITLESIN